MKRLTKWQKKALGSGYCTEMWNPKLAKLYPKALKQNLDDGNLTISQSYDDFIDFGTRLPNEEGTGRFIVGMENRSTIHLMYLKGSVIDTKIEEFISTYFQLPVVSTVTELSFQTKSNKRSFSDTSQHMNYPLKSIKKKLDVFSIFDVLVEYLPANAYTGCLLVDFPIAEDGDTIYGRACGNRVAVVSSDGIHTDRRNYILIIIHELLHTFGVDHCESFACIMNPMNSDENTLELCPSELRKLHNAVPYFDCKKRWKELEILCRNEGWINDAEWYAERLRLSEL